MGKYFTDSEYRLLLAALAREKEVCKQVNKESDGVLDLNEEMRSLEKKIIDVQYNLHLIKIKKTEFDPVIEYRPDEETPVSVIGTQLCLFYEDFDPYDAADNSEGAEADLEVSTWSGKKTLTA